MPPALLDGPEFQGRPGFGVQFPAVPPQAVARLQDHADDVGLHAPSTRGTFQRSGFAAEPMQVGHREEAVRVGPVLLVGGVPFLPVGFEGLEG